jgi:hypothetical protein
MVPNRLVKRQAGGTPFAFSITGISEDAHHFCEEVVFRRSEKVGENDCQSLPGFYGCSIMAQASALHIWIKTLSANWFQSQLSRTLNPTASFREKACSTPSRSI